MSCLGRDEYSVRSFVRVGVFFGFSPQCCSLFWASQGHLIPSCEARRPLGQFRVYVVTKWIYYPVCPSQLYCIQFGIRKTISVFVWKRKNRFRLPPPRTMNDLPPSHLIFGRILLISSHSTLSVFREDVCAWKHAGRCRLWNPEVVPRCGCSLWDRSNTPLTTNCFPCACFHLLRLQPLVPVLAALIILKWSATVWWFKALPCVTHDAVISACKLAMQNSKLPERLSRAEEGGGKRIAGRPSVPWPLNGEIHPQSQALIPRAGAKCLPLSKTNI